MKPLAHEIHESALKAAFEYKKSEAALITVIQQVDEFRVYFEYDYGSLFEYVTKALGLSEPSAYNFIAVSRKAVEVPEMKQAILDGKLTVSKVRKIIPVLNSGNQEEWLKKAMMLPQRKLEEEVARIAPQAVKQEQVRVVSEEIRELRISVSAELYEKLKRAQALEKSSSLEETLEKLVDFLIEKKDPVKKAERLSKKVNAPVLRQAGVPEIQSQARARHQVNARDQGQCTHIDPTGTRCGDQRFIEIHHITPRSMGGEDTPENLTTLCSAHHRLTHHRGH